MPLPRLQLWIIRASAKQGTMPAWDEESKTFKKSQQGRRKG